jgi:hypothetical protein
MANQSVSAGAQNIFSPALPVPSKTAVSVSVSGTFVGTVTLQRRFDGGAWHDHSTWTAIAETTYDVDEGGELRIGIKTGGYTSGTAVCRIGYTS